MDERKRAAISQVVCTLEGMSTLLERTPGDFAVVIHGDSDCSNVLVQGMDHPGAGRFFCTNLSEEEAITGRSSAKLESCLHLICERIHPRKIFVLGTCLSSLIGDDIEPLARRVGDQTGIPVSALAGAGMRFVSQDEITDRFACLMLDPRDTGTKDDNSVNLVGFDPGAELRGQLESGGLRINSILYSSATLDDWNRMAQAPTNVVLDSWLYKNFLEKAAACHSQRQLEVPFPVGLQATRDFLELLRCKVQAPAAAIRAVERGKSLCAGKRLGYNIGSKKNLDPRTLAKAGLTELPIFDELGFEIVILVQGDDHPARVESVRNALDELGCKHPIAVFSDTVFFADLCRDNGCDLVYASDHLADQAHTARVGFLDHGILEPGFDALEANVERITGALGKHGG